MSSRPKVIESSWEHVDWEGNPAQYTLVRESRHSVVYPFIADRIRNLSPSTLLDFGCGDGVFVDELCRDIPAQIVCYDNSQNMVTLARKRLADMRNVVVSADFGDIRSSRFDVVTMLAVWMTLPSETICNDVLLEIAGALLSGGTLLAAVTHPCFRESEFTSFYTDFSNRDYLKEGTPFNVYMLDGSSRIVLHDFHWSFGAMMRQLHAAGLVVCQVHELADHPALGKKGAHGSPWMVVEAAKP